MQVAEGNEKEKILKIKVSRDQSLIVAMVGKILDKGVKKVTGIKVYQIEFEPCGGGHKMSTVVAVFSQKLKPVMHKISTEFEFVYDKDDSVQELFLIDNIQIYIYNFRLEVIKPIVNFQQNFGQSLLG